MCCCHRHLIVLLCVIPRGWFKTPFNTGRGGACLRKSGLLLHRSCMWAFLKHSIINSDPNMLGFPIIRGNSLARQSVEMHFNKNTSKQRPQFLNRVQFPLELNQSNVKPNLLQRSAVKVPDVGSTCWGMWVSKNVFPAEGWPNNSP